jgi:hypothetical protein
MTKTKAERIAHIKEQILKLEAQKKQLIQKQKKDERAARTKRLIERGAIIESMVYNAVNMTNDDFKAYLQRHLVKLADPKMPQIEPQSGTEYFVQTVIEQDYETYMHENESEDEGG